MNIYQLGDKKPQLPPPDQYWIAPNATVLGDVILKKNASVWFGAVVRGDNDPIVIGENTNIQDGAVLHSDIGLPLLLGDDVTVGHMAMIHSCEVGDRSLIGIGAVVLARARIGKDTMIGAGTLIPEGKEFPDGVLIVGTPGRVVRELRPDEIERLKWSAAHYVANWKRYATDFKPA
jgi:carbonic anhydrase/acetyltransferase-like protein (isoleucine patch superfamily)